MESEELSIDKASVDFPHLQLMASCVDIVHKKMWGEVDADLSDPAALPSPLAGPSKILNH